MSFIDKWQEVCDVLRQNYASIGVPAEDINIGEPSKMPTSKLAILVFAEKNKPAKTMQNGRSEGKSMTVTLFIGVPKDCETPQFDAYKIAETIEELMFEIMQATEPETTPEAAYQGNVWLSLEFKLRYR